MSFSLVPEGNERLTGGEVKNFRMRSSVGLVRSKDERKDSRLRCGDHFSNSYNLI